MDSVNRAWIAPVGTQPDEPGWVEIGHIDTVLILDHEPLDEAWSARPPGPISISLRGRGRFPWRFYRLFWGTPVPRASRVKREYRRRRR